MFWYCLFHFQLNERHFCWRDILPLTLFSFSFTAIFHVYSNFIEIEFDCIRLHRLFVMHYIYRVNVWSLLYRPTALRNTKRHAVFSLQARIRACGADHSKQVKLLKLDFLCDDGTIFDGSKSLILFSFRYSAKPCKMSTTTTTTILTNRAATKMLDAV